MWLLFPCWVPNFSQHKMQHHPRATVSAAQHISSASLNFPRRFRTSAKLFTAMSVARCSGPSRRSWPSRPRRISGSASAKAPRACSTWASLGRSKYFLNSCYRLYFLMLFDACCKYCCNLQLSLCGFAAFLIISGCTSLVTGQYSLDSTIHVC